jgi:hypothetical protein
MDYARFNYIAQPGDENIRFIRQLGPYDHYSINWGYRKIPNIESPEQEVKTLDKWIESKADNPIYRFGNQRFDPSAQTEGIGNDQVKASTYGIKNLKIVAQNLPGWTSSQTNSYEDLSELYQELLSVWGRYIGHVVGNIGGVYEFNKKPNQTGYIYIPVTKEKQKESLVWLQKNAFKTQNWLLDKNILANFKESGYTDLMLRLQNRQLYSLLNANKLKRMIDAEVIQDDFYAISDMIRDLRTGLFFEANYLKNVDLFRRNLQKSFIDRLANLFNSKETKNSDINAIIRGELEIMNLQLTIATGRRINRVTKYHYRDCLAKIGEILNPKN